MRNNDQSENDIMSRAVYSLYSRYSTSKSETIGLFRSRIYFWTIGIPILLALAQGERKLN
jgi:hypothetical protein